MPRSPQWMDLYQIWFRVSSRGRNQLCGILLQSAHRFRFCEGSKFAISHWLIFCFRSSLTQCWRYRAACDTSRPNAIILHFCRAMSATAYAVMRCLCVCPSVTFVDHVETNKRIFEIFSPSGSHTILIVPYQTGWRYFDGNPPNGGVEWRWGIGTNCDSGLIAGYRWIAGRANYEVTKTVADDHAV